jgi:head-tail adaptor
MNALEDLIRNLARIKSARMVKAYFDNNRLFAIFIVADQGMRCAEGEEMASTESRLRVRRRSCVMADGFQ